MKIFCDSCYRQRCSEKHKKNYIPKPRKESPKTKIRKILESNKFIDIKTIAEILKITQNSVRTHIYYLRMEGTKIQRGYYLSEVPRDFPREGTYQRSVLDTLSTDKIITFDGIMQKTGLDNRRVTGGIKSINNRGIKTHFAYSLEEN